MTKIDTGGPAFPMATVDGWVQTGMTMREWFAGQALAGLCAHLDSVSLSSKEIAFIAYERADAMIAERHKDGAEDTA